MKTQITLALLAIFLAACAPAQTNATDVQNTAAVLARTDVALTQAARPTTTPLPPTFTSMPEITIAPGTPIPALPLPLILTPDPIQVERWQEYQTELANVLLRGYGPDAYKDALCEWDVLGHSSQEEYVWVYCIIRGGQAIMVPL